MAKPTTYTEYAHDLAAKGDYWLRHWKRTRILEEPKALVARGLVLAIEDVKEYFGISTDDFFEYASRWNKEEERLFLESGNLKSFYEAWTGQSARYNICANILNQLADDINTKVMVNLVCPGPDSNHPMLDFGCGSATLTITLALNGIIPSRAIVADIRNDVMDFVEFRIKKHALGSRIDCRDVTDLEGITCDKLVCIDVLEHLANASDIFTHHIHPRLVVGGLMYLRAPWRYQMTHLDAAAEDFYRNGGRRFLERKYKVLNRVLPIDIACLYKKISD